MGVLAYHHHRHPIAWCRLWRLGPRRGSYRLGWRLWLGRRLWHGLAECRLGRRLRWRLWWRLGSPTPLECWRGPRLGWGCLRLDVVGLAVLMPVDRERELEPALV
jgi:hypothetical protein